MKFKSKQNSLFNAQFIVAVLFPFVAAWFAYNEIRHSPWIILITFIPAIVLIWIRLSTRYEINDDKLLYRSAFIRGSIDVNTISKISRQQTAWVGKKAATGSGGIVVTYGDNKTIYITPENNETLIKHLKKINRSISVIP